MLITLKKVYVNSRFSQETNCFEAEVHVDGRALCSARNEGMGGPTIFHPVAGRTQADIQQVNDWIKANRPKHTSHGITIDDDLEIVVDELLEREAQRKAMKRTLKSKTVVTCKGSKSIFTYKCPYSSEMGTKIRNRDKDVEKILNELPEEQALDLWMASIQ